MKIICAKTNNKIFISLIQSINRVYYIRKMNISYINYHLYPVKLFS